MWLLDTLIRLAARLEENKSSAWSERQQIDLHQVAAAAVSGATRSHKSSFRHVLESQRMNHLLRWLRHRLGKNRAPAPAGWGDLICSSRCVTRICVHKRLRKKCQNYGSEGSLVFQLKLHFLGGFVFSKVLSYLLFQLVPKYHLELGRGAVPEGMLKAKGS